MRPLLGTNVRLDVALTRAGLHEASSSAVAWCKNHPGSGALTAHSLATLSYLLGRGTRPVVARAFIADLVAGFDIAAIGHPEIARALELPIADSKMP